MGMLWMRFNELVKLFASLHLRLKLIQTANNATNEGTDLMKLEYTIKKTQYYDSSVFKVKI
jgi:hypothetical protein